MKQTVLDPARCRMYLTMLCSLDPESRRLGAEGIVQAAFPDACGRRSRRLPVAYRRQLEPIPEDLDDCFTDTCDRVALAAMIMASVCEGNSSRLAQDWLMALRRDRSAIAQSLSALLHLRYEDLRQARCREWDQAWPMACAASDYDAHHGLLAALLRAVTNPNPAPIDLVVPLLRSGDRLWSQLTKWEEQAALLQRLTAALRGVALSDLTACPTLDCLTPALQHPEIAVRIHAGKLVAHGVPPQATQQALLTAACASPHPDMASVAIQALSAHHLPVSNTAILGLAAVVEHHHGPRREQALQSLCGIPTDTALVYLAHHLDHSPWAAVVVAWLWRQRRIHASQWAFFGDQQHWSVLLAPLWLVDEHALHNRVYTPPLHHILHDRAGPPPSHNYAYNSLSEIRQRAPSHIWQEPDPWWAYLRHEPDPRRQAQALPGCLTRSNPQQHSAMLCWALDHQQPLVRWAGWLTCYSYRGSAQASLAKHPGLRQRVYRQLDAADNLDPDQGEDGQALAATLAMMLAAAWKLPLAASIPRRWASSPVALHRHLALRCRTGNTAHLLAQQLHHDAQLLVRSTALRMLARQHPAYLSQASQDPHPAIRAWGLPGLLAHHPDHPSLVTAATQQDPPQPCRTLWHAVLDRKQPAAHWLAAASSCLEQLEDARVGAYALDYLLRYHAQDRRLPDLIIASLSPDEMGAWGATPYMAQYHAAPLLRCLTQHGWHHPQVADTLLNLARHPHAAVAVRRQLAVYAGICDQADPRWLCQLILTTIDCVPNRFLSALRAQLDRCCQQEPSLAQVINHHLATLLTPPCPRKVQRHQGILRLLQISGSLVPPEHGLWATLQHLRQHEGYAHMHPAIDTFFQDSSPSA